MINKLSFSHSLRVVVEPLNTVLHMFLQVLIYLVPLFLAFRRSLEGEAGWAFYVLHGLSGICVIIAISGGMIMFSSRNKELIQAHQHKSTCLSKLTCAIFCIPEDYEQADQKRMF